MSALYSMKGGSNVLYEDIGREIQKCDYDGSA